MIVGMTDKAAVHCLFCNLGDNSILARMEKPRGSNLIMEYEMIVASGDAARIAEGATPLKVT